MESNRFKLFFVLVFLSIRTFAQNTSKPDSTSNFPSIKSFFKKGNLEGRSRMYYMHTDNAKPYEDYTGLAIGNGLRYTTPTFKGLSGSFGGYYIINMNGTQNLGIDSLTQTPSRYELGLFDIENPKNQNLVRLENLYIRYKKGILDTKYGQFTPKYAFLNGQDGRMSPTMVRGLNIGINPNKNLTLELNWINKISPRSTIRWYSVSESMALYPMGRNENGKKSQYSEYLNTKSLYLLTLNYKIQNKLSFKTEQYILPQEFSLNLTQIEFNSEKWQFGNILIFQNVLKSNAETIEKYINSNSFVQSFRIQRNFSKSFFANINFTNISKSGRFLFPREWGKEPFYTFMPRERNEGTGDTKALNFNLNYKTFKKIELNGSYGRFYLNSDPFYNKYTMPSYSQTNLYVKKNFNKAFDGFSAEILYVRKSPLDKSLSDPKQIVNKVNLNLLNVIFNFAF
ncbi:hypothetical protein EGI22_09610 [Lacihabitans sp. LS3-19]|uniref:hypothetical protein n=1 Tax=Lacihabitans sp. LS3-19 TaxID=2487335 RepID=UPI0020CDEA67|nr:hypothetical protein [Lacihabitans sp. LS3-19]MCP9768169.1 hypothetical protein [Lacihabitans sp. LS3-19]